MDSGHVGMIMAVQEAIESDEGEQEEPHEIWGGKEWLDPRLVKEGRLDELGRLTHFDVYEVVDECEATGQIVDAKWLTDRKETRLEVELSQGSSQRNLWSICLQVRQTPQY